MFSISNNLCNNLKLDKDVEISDAENSRHIDAIQAAAKTFRFWNDF